MSVPYAEPHFPFGTEKDLVLHKFTMGEHYQNEYNNFKNEKWLVDMRQPNLTC